MESGSDRMKATAAVALVLCVAGGVLVRRTPVVGAALVVGGLICGYLAIMESRRQR